MEDLANLKRASEKVAGSTPQEVLDAFIPKGSSIGDFPLVDITYGHALFFASIEHPLAKNSFDDWDAQDLGLAFFAMTRDSKELHRLVREGELEESLFEFLEQVPINNHVEDTQKIILHYLGSTSTAVEMKSKDSDKGTQKKTPSDGFWGRLRGFVASIIGSLTSLFTNSRYLKHSHSQLVRPGRKA